MDVDVQGALCQWIRERHPGRSTAEAKQQGQAGCNTDSGTQDEESQCGLLLDAELNQGLRVHALIALHDSH